MDARKVFHVAGEKIKGLNDDNIKGFLPGIVQQLQQAVASHQ